METLATWEKILVGIVLVLVLLWFRPGIKAAFERGDQVKDKDWAGFLIPIALVALFVVLLLYAI